MSTTDRMANAIRMAGKEKKVLHVEGNLYLVESETTPGRVYEVRVPNDSCSCPDFQTRMTACKHVLLTRMSIGDVSPNQKERAASNALPADYLREDEEMSDRMPTSMELSRILEGGDRVQ